ncbi:MAG: hypothetical protein ACK2UK_04840 [Candidatus Promineifilaceae bacterium]
MQNAANNKVSILLVCPPGLAQLSLVTTVNAFSWAAVVARAADVAAAVTAAQKLGPDILVADAALLPDVNGLLLKQIRQVNPEIICVVLADSPLQRKAALAGGAHFALGRDNLNRHFPQVLNLFQTSYRDHL